jgi:hypothetical protein
VVKDVLAWNATQKGVKDLVENFMFLRGDKWNGMLIFLFGAISWSLCLNKIISTPGALIYKCVSFLQH